jgi:hypothetical protein
MTVLSENAKAIRKTGSSTVSYNGTDATITEATLTGHDVYDGVLKFVQVLNVICIPASLLVGLENAKAIRKTLADNLENEFEFITHIVRTFPTNPTKRLAGIHMTLRTWTNFNTPS